MSKRDFALLLMDMLESVQKVKRYTLNFTYSQFIEDDKTIDAVVRNFEIIGEAANRLDDEFKKRYAEVDWNKIRGFRNRLIHEYFGVDYEIVWEVISTELNELEFQLEQIIDALV